MAKLRDHLIVDTDIHTDLNGTHIRDCLPEPWRTRYASRNLGAGHIGYWNPGGVTRADPRLPDGSAIQSTPATLGRHFLDVYGIDYAILNAGTAVGLPDREIAEVGDA